MRTVVLIPAHNEESTIARVVLRCRALDHTVIVCDDGSGDMTGKIAESLGAEVIRHEVNMGYGASLSSLFQRALETEGEVFVTLDADGQHDPDEIRLLVDPLEKGDADIVVGSRFLGKKNEVPRYRQLGIKLITGVSNRVSQLDLSDAQSGFRAYNRKALASVIPSDFGMGASTEILSRASGESLRVAEVPIAISYPAWGASRNPVYHGAEVLLSSVKHLSILHPLVVYGIPGTVLMLYGLFLGFHALDAYEATRIVYVGTTLIAIGCILVGLMLGITALLLWIMITLMRDPRYKSAR